jgi:low temperature requirement protein LtrA
VLARETPSVARAEAQAPPRQTSLGTDRNRAGRGGPHSRPNRHLRPRDGQEQRTTAVELFFDLVYAFALTQLAQLVIQHNLSLLSLGQAAFLLLVIWWAWIYTAWWVNWFDPASVEVRLVIVVGALASLLMSAAIPEAFGKQAGLFAGSYLVLQVGRNLSAMLLPGRGHPLRRNFERVLAWSLCSAPLWIAGAVWRSLQYELWGAALAVELLAPLVGYPTPGLGRSQTTEWDVEGGHFAERFQSFIIIALGESIVVTGATGTAGGLSERTVLAVAVAFIITAALWWLYFGVVAEHSRRQLAEAEDPGRLARDAYSYLHLPIVAGIILVAIGDDLMIANPDGTLAAAGVAVTVAGPAVYLLGEALVRLRMIHAFSAERLLTIFALVVLALAGRSLSALELSCGIAVILAALAVSEYEPVRALARRAVSRRRHRVS